ncbi:putative mitochondrial peptidyl-trna hydrolase [Diplodia seriata]|uniref:peptidyl-tRNA hydrolase n=1 Tax=Diplodia seriata TaxID=420778 RepID=A0A0G2HKB0_9PEZI|nr:putative mitochondrial peptidyl-trna hydrolase [Diplodia seriata]OMP85396.1 putative peptidyl-tRNA hydrolase 2 [Diplodia seriata]
MSLMRQSVSIPLPWLVSAFVGTLGGVIFGGLWLGKRVSEEWYLQGVEAGRASAKAKKDKSEKKDEEESSSEEESDSEDEEDDEVERQELDPFTDRNEECKLVLVVRTDLKMGSGKIAAQCGHATLACYKAFLRQAPESPLLRRWERYGQMKVALKCTSEEDMQLLQAQAMSLGLCAQIIHDAGRTQIAAGSATVLGIGPGPVSVINQVTGNLRLL